MGADFEYEGEIYVRPVGRGVSLVDLDWQDLDEAIESAVAVRYGAVSGWQGQARIRVEIGLEHQPEKAP
jgi:hypothetical protein